MTKTKLQFQFRLFYVFIFQWSSDYSWFPGYKWRVCLCPKCSRHLGWMFEPEDSESIDSLHFPSKRGFFALITGDILSESCK